MLEQSREEELRRFAAVVRDSNDAILLLDFEGRIRAWNRGAEQMYGYSEAEALNMNVMELVPPDLRDGTRLMLKQLQQGKTIRSYETQRATKDGRVLDVWLTATVLRDDHGRPNMVATTERDITERKRIDARLESTLEALREKTEEVETTKEELEVVNEELRSTNDALVESGRHLADVSSTMAGYSHIIEIKLEEPLKELNDGIGALKSTGNAGVERQAEALSRYSTAIASTIKDLSTLFYASSIEVHPGRVDLSRVVRSIVDELKAREPGSKVRFIIPRGITVYADERLIGLAARHILENSWGHVHEHDNGLMAFYGQVYGNEKVITFFDNRRKFDPGEFNLFSPPPSGEDGLQDVDLGLLVAKAIIERNDGKFWIDYAVGKGLNFCITLPVYLEYKI